MMFNKNLIVLVLFMILGCQFQPNQKLVSNDWIKDKKGCLNLRTPKLANHLLDSNNLEDGSKKEFIEVFGEPNKTNYHNGSDVLIYYFNSGCDGNELAEESDKCYAEFYFNNDNYQSVQFICE